MSFGWLKKATKTTGAGKNELATYLAAHLAGELGAAAKGYSELFHKKTADCAAGLLLAAVRVQQGSLAGVLDLVAGLSDDSGDVAVTIADSLGKAAGGNQPALIPLLLDLGYRMKQYNAPEQSLLCYRVAALVDPQSAEALYRIGDTLHDYRHFEEARQALSAALQADPDHWGARYTLAVLLQDVGCDAEAIGHYQQALLLLDEHAKSHNNLGSALLNTGQLHLAIPHLNRAVELNPDFAQAWTNLGTVLNLQGKYPQALAALEQASALGAPLGNRVRHALILPAVASGTAEILAARSRMQAELQALQEEGVTLVDPLREVGITPFYLACHGLDDLPLLRQLSAFYAASSPQLGRVAWHCTEGAPRRAEDAKVRVGFVSNFFDGNIGRYFGQVIARLSRERFEVSVISTFVNDDPIVQAICDSADQGIQIPMNLSAAQQMIEEAQLDLLIYCDIGREPLSYFLAFARLAPVQIALPGHPESTGIPGVDYFLSHAGCEPEEGADHYSEKLLLLSREVAPTCCGRPQFPATALSRADLSLDPEAHLYLCPESLPKIHPDMDQLFAQILQGDPRGVLLLCEAQHSHWKDVLSQRLAAAIPDFSTRVRFLPGTERDDFLGLLQLADVILDPLHFADAATTLDAIAVGTPSVTLPGRFLRGRQALACYQRLGIEECVAWDTGEYVQKALALGCDPELRAELSRRILAAAPLLFDDLGMVRELEDLLESVVRQ